MGKIILVFLCLFSAVVCGQSSNLNSNSNPNPQECEIPEEFQKKMQELEKFHEEFKELKSALVDLSAAFIRFSQALTKGKTGETGAGKNQAPNQNSTTTANANAKPTTATAIVNGEKVIVVPEISCRGKNGRWEKLQVCPESKIVTGHRFRHLRQNGLTGLELKCTEKFKQNETEIEHILRVNSEAGENLSRGTWGKWKNKSRSTFAQGFSFNRNELSLTCSASESDLIYHSANQTVNSELDSDSTRVVTKCPPDHAICGVTAMMDKAGRGTLTSIGLKCCHHCFPEEKWVTVHHFNNTGDLEEEQKVFTTVGLQRSLRRSADYVEIPHSVVHEGFSSRFGTSNLTGFDWSRTSYSIWTEETMVTHTYTCQAQSSCVLKQLVGQCGSVRVPVLKFCKVSVPVGSSVPDSCNFNPPSESEYEVE